LHTPLPLTTRVHSSGLSPTSWRSRTPPRDRTGCTHNLPPELLAPHVCLFKYSPRPSPSPLPNPRADRRLVLAEKAPPRSPPKAIHRCDSFWSPWALCRSSPRSCEVAKLVLSPFHVLYALLDLAEPVQKLAVRRPSSRVRPGLSPKSFLP
jgi:hypothetical protein